MFARMVYGGGLAMVFTHLVGQGQFLASDRHDQRLAVLPAQAQSSPVDGDNRFHSPSQHVVRNRLASPSRDRILYRSVDGMASQPWATSDYHRRRIERVSPTCPTGHPSDDYRPVPQPSLAPPLDPYRRVQPRSDVYRVDPMQFHGQANGWNF